MFWRPRTQLHEGRLNKNGAKPEKAGPRPAGMSSAFPRKGACLQLDWEFLSKSSEKEGPKQHVSQKAGGSSKLLLGT